MKRITLKILLFLVFTDILEAFAQFCFKKSALAGYGLKAAFSSGFLWVAVFSVFLIFILWSTILSKIDLSVAVPVASFSYILVPFVSIIFLGEKVTAFRWLGISFILLGVIFVSLSSKEKEGSL